MRPPRLGLVPVLGLDPARPSLVVDAEDEDDLGHPGLVVDEAGPELWWSWPAGARTRRVSGGPGP